MFFQECRSIILRGLKLIIQKLNDIKKSIKKKKKSGDNFPHSRDSYTRALAIPAIKAPPSLTAQDRKLRVKVPSQALVCQRVRSINSCGIQYFAFHSSACACEFQPVAARHAAPASALFQPLLVTCLRVVPQG